jgi:hypothetical protein
MPENLPLHGIKKAVLELLPDFCLPPMWLFLTIYGTLWQIVVMTETAGLRASACWMVDTNKIRDLC